MKSKKQIIQKLYETEMKVIHDRLGDATTDSAVTNIFLLEIVNDVKIIKFLLKEEMKNG